MAGMGREENYGKFGATPNFGAEDGSREKGDRGVRSAARVRAGPPFRGKGVRPRLARAAEGNKGKPQPGLHGEAEAAGHLAGEGPLLDGQGRGQADGQAQVRGREGAVVRLGFGKPLARPPEAQHRK
jgi:hypothetical protein